MPTPTERVRDAVNDLQQWLSTSPNPGEAVVRQAIVLRLLQAAGFDIWNPAEVVPEETNVTGNRPDFLVRAGPSKFPLEIKGMNVGLQPVHYQQVVAYAANEGTRWALLTNGRVWVVLDRTNNPAGTFIDHEVLKLELAQEGQTFADDLATLLDVETWRADTFAQAVATVQQRQQQRRDEQRIQQEKRPVVEAIRAKYQIPTFELAAENAVEGGKITEAERDVLLGRPAKIASIQSVRQAAKVGSRSKTQAPMLSPYQGGAVSTSSPTPEGILFTYQVANVEARAIYNPSNGTWTVKAGSTAVVETKPYAERTRRRRDRMLQQGDLEKVGGLFLRYLKDVTYTSPSGAADDISGASENGWVAWKDSEGRPAQHYRPKDQPG